MLKSNLVVVVTPPPHADLNVLMRDDGPLKHSCGNVGTSLARRLFESSGPVVVAAGNLVSAFDTQEGVNAMLDNFEFTVESTQYPLLFELLR